MKQEQIKQIEDIIDEKLRDTEINKLYNEIEIEQTRFNETTWFILGSIFGFLIYAIFSTFLRLI